MQLQYFVRNALICLGCVIRRKMFLVKYSLKNTPKFCIKIPNQNYQHKPSTLTGSKKLPKFRVKNLT